MSQKFVKILEIRNFRNSGVVSNDAILNFFIIIFALRKKVFKDLIKLLLVDWLFEKLQINLQMKVLKLSKVSKFFKTEKVSKDILFNYKKKKQQQ